MSSLVGDLLVKLRGDTAQFEASMKTATARMQKFSTEAKAIGRGISMALSLPLLAVGVAATKMSTDFDMALSKVVGLVGLSREEVAAWRKEILQMGPSVGKSAKELGDALFYVTSAGIRGTAVMETIKFAAKGAAAGLGDTAVVADTATSAMNAYAKSNMSAEMATSILVATVREGKAEAASLAPVLGRILPVAATLGVSFDQVGAAMAAMTRLGFDAATSATSLRATMIQLTKVTPAQEKAASDLGLSFDKIRKAIREDGLLAGLQMIKDAVGENEVAMTSIFPNVRALSGVLAMMGDSAEATTAIFARMAKTTEKDLADAFAAAEAEAGFKFKQALISIQNLLIRIGDDILPRLVPQVEKLTAKMEEWSKKWDEMNPKTKEMILNFSKWAIILGPAIIAVGSLAGAIRSIVLVAGGLAGVWATFTGATAVAGAIGGVGAAAATAGPALAAATTPLMGMAPAATAAVGGLTLATAGLVAATAAAIAGAYALNQWVMETETFATAMGYVADRTQDLNAGLSESRDSYEAQLLVTQKMIKQLGLEGDEWKLQAEWTMKNAANLSKVTEKVVVLAREKSTLGRTMKDLIAASDAEKEKMVANADAVTKAVEDETAAESAHLDELKKKYEVLSKDDIAAQMSSIAEDFNALKDTVDTTQLAEKFNEPMLQIAKLAAENKVAIPQPFRDAASALGDKLAPGMKNLIDQSVNFRNDFATTGKVIEGIFWSTGDTAEAALSGGFKNGITTGIENGKVVMDAFVKRLEEDVIYIPVQPNLEGWNQAVEDAIAGRIPNTTG